MQGLSTSLVLIAVLAVAAPLAARFLDRKVKVPIVVFEIVLGISLAAGISAGLVGPHSGGGRDYRRRLVLHSPWRAAAYRSRCRRIEVPDRRRGHRPGGGWGICSLGCDLAVLSGRQLGPATAVLLGFVLLTRGSDSHRPGRGAYLGRDLLRTRWSRDALGSPVSAAGTASASRQRLGTTPTRLKEIPQETRAGRRLR
jgi:hypothetical protein